MSEEHDKDQRDEIVPFGAVPATSLERALREVCAYYDIKPRALRSGAGERAKEARDGLFYVLAKKHRWSAARVAQAIGCSERTVRNGVKRHVEAIALFRETHGIAAPESE